MAKTGKMLLNVSQWRLAQWILFLVACTMFLSLLLPWIKRTALFDAEGLSVAKSLAQETHNPFILKYLLLPRSDQMDVAFEDFFRGRNAFGIFIDLRIGSYKENESHFFVGHILDGVDYPEKAYLFLLFPILTICVAVVAIIMPKGPRLAGYLGSALLILYVTARIRLLMTDGARDIAGIALGPGIWIWLYCVLLLGIWLVLRATFPRSKIF